MFTNFLRFGNRGTYEYCSGDCERTTEKPENINTARDLYIIFERKSNITVKRIGFMIFDSVLDISATREGGPSKDKPTPDFAKAEYLTPAEASRTARRYMIEQAEPAAPPAGMTIMETTSGNTGIGIALVA